MGEHKEVAGRGGCFGSALSQYPDGKSLDLSALEKPIRLGYCLEMVTVYRAHGLRIVIFTDDHEPAHVHVFGDGHVKIDLVGSNDAPELIFATDMKRSDIRRAMQIVTDNQSNFLAKWREIHG